MKYDPETSTIEFTVQVPVEGVVRAARNDHGHLQDEDLVPVAALMQLLVTYRHKLNLNVVIDLLKSHPDFAEALALESYFHPEATGRWALPNSAKHAAE